MEDRAVDCPKTRRCLFPADHEFGGWGRWRSHRSRTLAGLFFPYRSLCPWMLETAFLVALHERARAHKVPLWALKPAIFQVPQLRARLTPDAHGVKAAKKGVVGDHRRDGDYRMR